MNIPKIQLSVWIIPVLVLMLLSCGGGSRDTDSLRLRLRMVDSGFKVAGAQLSEGTALNSSQQGSYQIRLLDRNQNIIDKIAFETIGIEASENAPPPEFIVNVPLYPNLNQLVIYGMDGSSGHYRVDKSKVLLAWTLPDSIRSKTRDNRQE